MKIEDDHSLPRLRLFYLSLPPFLSRFRFPLLSFEPYLLSSWPGDVFSQRSLKLVQRRTGVVPPDLTLVPLKPAGSFYAIATRWTQRGSFFGRDPPVDGRFFSALSSLFWVDQAETSCHAFVLALFSRDYFFEFLSYFPLGAVLRVESHPAEVSLFFPPLMALR